jgi:hypothetical protein
MEARSVCAALRGHCRTMAQQDPVVATFGQEALASGGSDENACKERGNSPLGGTTDMQDSGQRRGFQANTKQGLKGRGMKTYSMKG